MQRREFITLLGGAAAWPISASAQPWDGTRHIGLLMGIKEADPEGAARVDALRQGLRQFGWTEGQNIRLDVQWTEADVQREGPKAIEVLAQKPALIVVYGARALSAVRQADRTTPIIFIGTSDPVRLGLVESLARPGGNTTGFAIYEFSLVAKMLETIKEVDPSISRVALLGNPQNPNFEPNWHTLRQAASAFAVEAVTAPVGSPSDIEQFVVEFARKPHSALVVPPDVTATVHRKLIIDIAARHRLPAIYGHRFFVQDGGLLAYVSDLPDLFRRAAEYVDRVLKGEKPGVLPVQMPTRVELVINIKTAKTLGLTVPATLLARADEVIE